MTLSLYIHVPFCKKKCDYCHFFVIPDRESTRQDWFLSLKKEWQLLKPKIEQHPILTLYFGGGTPSLLPSDWIAEIVSWLPNTPKEITLELNPDDASLDYLKALLNAGVNRLSIGVQTFDDKKLQELGRLHSSDKAKNAISLAKEAGFSNISADLMFDLPHQTLHDWEMTLKSLIALPVTHVSLYNLTIEPNTLLFKNHNKIKAHLPSEETSREMYLLADRVLSESGFERYEISAFAKPSCRSLHNIGYWTGRSFLGLGPSAFSYDGKRRSQNVLSISSYKSLLNASQLPVGFEEELPPTDALKELFTIALRVKEGVDLDAFQKRYAPLEEKTLKTLLEYETMGWIENAATHPKLTLEGILFYDTIAVGLI